MNLPALNCPPTVLQLPQAVSHLEVCLETLKSDLATLESRLQQTRSKYWEVMQQLEAVKAQLSGSQPVTLVEASCPVDEVDLDLYMDADWEHLMTQINNL